MTQESQPLTFNELTRACAFGIGHSHADVFEFFFTPTEVGTAVHIKCTKCSETKDITEYEVW